MRKGFIILASILVFSSCGNQQEESDKKEDEKTIPNDDSLLVELSSYFEWTSISESEFEKHKSQAEEVKNGTQNEPDAIAVSNDRIKRVERNLVVKGNNKSKVFTDVFEEDAQNYGVEEEPVTHLFLGLFKEISLVFLMQYEFHEYLFIDMQTFDEHKCWGYPRISPDTSMIICVNSDLSSGFTNNGIQLFNKKNNIWMKRWEKELQKIGPDEIYWIDNESLVLKANYWPIASNDIIVKYYQLKLKN